MFSIPPGKSRTVVCAYLANGFDPVFGDIGDDGGAGVGLLDLGEIADDNRNQVRGEWLVHLPVVDGRLPRRVAFDRDERAVRDDLVLVLDADDRL
jgi:hypothetical protein